MNQIKLSNGFSIGFNPNGLQSLEVYYTDPEGRQVSGELYGRNELQKLRKALVEVIGRKPVNADGVKMREIADLIEINLPGLAFVLLVAEFDGPHGLSNYISNGDRSDCIKWMRETADRIERNTSFPTPENN